MTFEPLVTLLNLGVYWPCEIGPNIYKDPGRKCVCGLGEVSYLT